MTNEEALEILTKERAKRRNASDGYPTRYAEALGMAIEALEQTRWIPVSERLPEENGKYLISLRIEAYSCRTTHETRTAVWTGERWRFDTYSGVVAKYYVIAWMPLPEPYKAESEEK